jgi:hypothetical protein
MVESVIAYIDAGSGSLILQVLTGGVAAVAVALKLYWRRLRSFVRLRRRDT